MKGKRRRGRRSEKEEEKEEERRRGRRRGSSGRRGEKEGEEEREERRKRTRGEYRRADLSLEGCSWPPSAHSHVHLSSYLVHVCSEHLPEILSYLPQHSCPFDF